MQEFITVLHHGSLVPRPSQCPVFAVYKNRGGRPGPLYHMNDTSVDRERKGSLIERTHLVHVFFVLNQEWHVFHFANVKTPANGADTTR